MPELGVVLADWKVSVTASNVLFNVPKIPHYFSVCGPEGSYPSGSAQQVLLCY